MDFGTAKDRVVKRIHNDDNATFLILAEEWLNEIMHDIVSQNPSWSWLEEEGSLAIVADTASYAISSIGNNIGNIFTISIDDPPLVFKPKDAFTFTMMNADLDARSGTPRIYTIWDGNILLSPVPDENDTAAVKYYKLVEDLENDSDLPPWGTNQALTRCWLTGARAMALDYVEDVRSEIYQARYEKLLAQMKGGDGINVEQQIISSPYSRANLSTNLDFDPTGPLAGILD